MGAVTGCLRGVSTIRLDASNAWESAVLPEISKAYLDGRLMPLLGAGASRTSTDSTGLPLPLSNELAKELASICDLPYSGEELAVVYSAIHDMDAAGLESFFQRRLTRCRPGNDLLSLLRYRWSRIYTLNIDDTLEVAARTTHTQKLRVFGRLDSLAELDPVFDELQIIKLNGSADRFADGLIFSPQEYGAGSARVPPWYRELGQNYSSHIFVFVGTALHEPLLQHIMADMRQGSRRGPQRGYLISPHATGIQIKHLDSLNITHVSGTLGDFVEFLSSAIGRPPTGWDLAVARRPELRNLAAGLPAKQQRALNSVIVVGTNTLPRTAPTGAGPIRAFYRGFKPRWVDILDGVPANLAVFDDFLNLIRKEDARGKLIGLLGPAGSGKTTMLMSAALTLSGLTNNPVYFLRESVDDIGELLLSLEEINSGVYYVFIDRLDIIARNLTDVYERGLIKRGSVIFSERQNIWRRRLRETCEKYVASTFTIDRIQKADVDPILEKLRQFGPWTRLEPMTVALRRKELYDKSSRQLLIGLLETTNGVGFTQIIRRDYGDIGSERHEKLLVIVGLATIHRAPISLNIVGRALEHAGVDAGAGVLAAEMEGVVERSNDTFGRDTRSMFASYSRGSLIPR
jgi:hypothetical protein